MAALLAAWLVLLAGLLLAYRRRLLACWREPVLRVPVLILESDDWGAGPAEQAAALRRLAALLQAVRDETGQPAVMTLGLVLAIIDRAVWRKDGTYAALSLAAAGHHDILQALREGIAAGVFAPQLHGMEHYWPDALLRRAAEDERVRRWLADDAAVTESLPDALQSRWTDGASLPSRPLPPQQVHAAVAEEARLFTALFAVAPRVAVPNTFVWNDDVERAWAAAGVRYVVTPGVRYRGRAADGRLVADRDGIRNGDAGADGLRYLVRDVYFEPARGHGPERILQGLRERWALGRPCLVETHRFNYLGAGAEAAWTALAEALPRALAAAPGLRFISTAALGDALDTGDATLIESRPLARVAVWTRRVCALPRFGRLARLSGLAAILRGVAMLARAASGPAAAHPLPADGGGPGRG